MARYAGVRATGGGIQIRYQVGGRSYSRWLATTPTDAALQDAARLRRRLIEQARLGVQAPGQPLAFEAACVAALAALSKRRKASTILAYRKRLEAHWSALAGLDVRLIRREDIADADAAQEWRSQKTRRDAVSALSCVLQWAVDTRRRSDNPARGFDRYPHQRPEVHIFDERELAAILGALRGQPAAFFALMAETGCRTGELRALRWEDVEPDAIRITGTLWNGQKTATKNYRSRRILLTARAREILREHTATRFSGGWVFTTQRGNPYDDKDLVAAFQRACKAAGVPYRRPYTLRHTHASRCLTAGCKPSWLADRLGDDVSTVLRVYARWIGGTRDQQELAKLEMSWQGAQGAEAK